MTERANRRFTVEEIDNGWLVKVTEMGSDKLVGRSAYLTIEALVAALEDYLSED